MDTLGWSYAFRSEQDYHVFTNLLTNFFDKNPYSLPKTVIELKPRSKTKVAKALHETHTELGLNSNLKSNTNFFEIIKILNHFANESISNIYKALTR